MVKIVQVSPPLCHHFLKKYFHNKMVRYGSKRLKITVNDVIIITEQQIHYTSKDLSRISNELRKDSADRVSSITFSKVDAPEVADP